MYKTAIWFVRRAWLAAMAVLVPAVGRAQPPADLAGETPACTRRGRLHRMFHHTAHTVQDKMIGYPENFAEPPLGYYVTEQLAVQTAKADPHRFTLYKSDFLPGTTSFSPIGASRYNIMATRMSAWPGPITIEWTPERPELAEARRLAVVETLLKTGQPTVASRVVIAPSRYPGAMGVEAANHFATTIARSQMAGQGLALPPTESASMGVR
jgi:hypothetical protein